MQSSVYGAFAAKLAAAVAKLKVGNGLEPGVSQGPLIDPPALEKVEQLVADAVERFFPPGTRFSRPRGGFALWLELPDPAFDSVKLFHAARKEGIGMAPGPLFSARGGYRHALRLSCTAPWDADQARRLARLGELAGQRCFVGEWVGQPPAGWRSLSLRQALAGQAIGRDMREPFEQSVRWVLERFGQGGFAALEKFMDERVPKDKRQEVAQTYVKIVQGAVVEVDAMARAKAGLPRLAMTEGHYRFLLDSLVATSATFDYGSPLFLQLDGFDEVKASGLQITRSPGKTIVYLGSMLLVLGIICMFYIRELRVWVLVKSDQVRVAMASNRKTSDLDRDFARHRDALQQLARGE